MGTFSPVGISGLTPEFSWRPSAFVRLRLMMLGGMLSINFLGAAIVYLLAILVVPLPVVYTDEQAHSNLVFLLLLLPGFSFVVLVRGYKILEPTRGWVTAGRRPYPDEQRLLLATPRAIAVVHALIWGFGTIAFGIFNGLYDVQLGWVVGLLVFISGLTACTVSYLLTERVLRPFARQALRRGVPERLRVRSVTSRSMAAWLLGTGAPVLGIGMVGISSLSNSEVVSVRQLAITMLVLGAVAFAMGLLTTFLAAKASSDPIRALRLAFAKVSHGNLNAEVQIYDGTEIGLLQAGFNEMVVGLRERERMRDLFGRHVGGDVAKKALEGGVQLGGEARRVAVLFVDIVGSTALATERPPNEVVALLNHFFDVVIDVVHQHDGWINKFEGDAALAVWGAPVGVPDMEARVLQAARVLGQRLRTEVVELEACIGVSAGIAVAGNVGAAERYEYTVIGDPVNEAARLTGLAKTHPGHVVANAQLLAVAGDEAQHWIEHTPVTVRGRTEPTYLAVPID
jgi:adenylate cyclase